MRALFIDDKAKSEVARVVAFAMDHLYYPGKSSVPGDDPRFVAMLNTYRCVFTFTHIPQGTFRHLTISIPRKNMYPNEIATFVIADLFGFTGYDEINAPHEPGADWMIGIENNAVMIAQQTDQL